MRISAAGILLIASLLVSLAAPESGIPSGNRPPQDLPATQAFARWLSQERTAGPPVFTNPQTLAAGLELVQARFQELRSLMEKDPEEFIHQAMPVSERAKLPAQLQSLVEHRVKGRGFFGVYCAGLPRHPDDEAGTVHTHGGVAYVARMNGIEYRAFVFGRWRDQTTVQDAEIEGVALDDAIAIGDSPSPDEQAASGSPVAAAAPTTTGPNTLLYIIARFSDQAGDPIDDATALSQMTVVSNFWRNNSSGSVYLRGLANPAQVMDIVHITLPQPVSYASTYNNNFSLLLSDARNAASARGFNYSSYNLDLVVTTGSGFGYAGYAWIGAQGAHCVQGYTSLRTSGHELGHNLGLYHADYWRTDSTRPFGRDSVPGGYAGDASNGEWIQYGHYFSLMAAQFGGEIDDATKPHYAAAEKVRLGWLSGSEVQYVSGSGNYRLYRHDHGATLGNPRAIRIETPAADYTGAARRYWLNYRLAPWATGQDWLRNGVQVDVCQTSYGSDGAIQLDMTPFSKDDPAGASHTSDNTDKLDGALIVGRTYNDTSAGIHITPIATGNNGANEEYIDVAINLGNFAGNRAPVITSFAASTNQVAANQSVNFNISATDPDGDTLAYSWAFDEVQVWTSSGLNSAAASKSWPNAGQYRVTVTVSDMKGSIASESQIVTVGTPANTGQIWGRVVWGGTPVYGARVSTSAGGTVYQAWTDSDGTYVLTDLASASTYPVACAAAGLTFTAQFSNPVSVAGGNALGKDFYANESLPGGGGGSAYVVSGQVTYGGSGVGGAEVRAGGFAVTTDASGNYQFTNFPSGNYTIAPRKDNWTLSPASRAITVSGANSSGNNFSRVAPNAISGRVDGPPTSGNSPAPTVYLSNGQSVQANATGSGPNKYWGYTLNNVPAGQYSLSAGLSGYRIVAATFSNPLTIAGDLSAINFTGSAGTVAGAISGRITRLGTPLAGVTVQVKSGSVVVSSDLTDSDGYFRAGNLSNGAYTILPTLAGYAFSPASLNVGSVPASGQNFTATGGGSAPNITSVTATPAVVPSGVTTTTLAVSATGSGTLTYAWDALSAPAPVTFSVNDSSSAATTTAGFQSPGNYTFRARVTGTNGLSATANVNVTVNAGAGAMVVAPYEAQTAAGQTVAFRADAWDQLGNRTSVSPLWSVSGGGSIDSGGLFAAAVPGGPYLITATAGTLSATGSVWVTTAAAPISPVITAQPQNQAVAAGSNFSFTIVATGTSPFAYQWRLNGTNISGATTNPFSKLNAQSADAGSYTVVVSNLAGTAISGPAALTVNNFPSLNPIADQTIHAGSTLVLANSAFDADAPPQQLTFSLLAGAPASATLDPTNGAFVWSALASDAGSTNAVTVQVADNGSPSLNTTDSFLIRVVSSLRIESITVSNATTTIRWTAIPGKTYRVEYRAELNAGGWNILLPDIQAIGPTATTTDSALAAGRYYRVLLLE